MVTIRGLAHSAPSAHSMLRVKFLNTSHTPPYKTGPLAAYLGQRLLVVCLLFGLSSSLLLRELTFVSLLLPLLISDDRC